MTVIACKDGVMAADSGVWWGDIWMPSDKKLRRLSDGSICGTAGWKPEIETAIAWYEAGANPKDRPSPPSDPQHDVDILILRPDRTLWCICDNFRLYPNSWPIGAAGAHGEFLYAAMLAGLSAEAAVTLAVAHCARARGPVVVMEL